MTNKLSDSAYAGAIAGCLTRAITQPLDVVKIRLQLQIEPIKITKKSQYYSIWHTISKIYTDEGFKALWKGHTCGQLLSITYGTVQFVTYETVSEMHFISTQNLAIKNFISGAISGTTGVLVSFPFDVMRTRMVAQYENRKLYNGTIHGIYTCAKLEGIRAYYRGLLPTLIQIVPYTGSQFMYYNLLKKTLPNDQHNFLTEFISGSISGLLAKATIHPIDVLKKRLQIQQFVYKNRPSDGQYFVCNGIVDACKKIWIHEGPIGFLKGLQPNLIKAMLTTGMYFAFYENIKRILRNFHEINQKQF